MSLIRNLSPFTLAFAFGLSAVTTFGCGSDTQRDREGRPDADHDSDPEADAGTGNGSEPHDCDDPVIIDQDIEEDTVFDEACYRAPGQVDIEAELLIEPGTVVEIESHGFNVEPSGVIIAEGTQDAKIVFTSTAGQPAGWRGIVVQGEGHSFDHVVIEEAGEEAGGFTYQNPANLHIISGSASVTNTELRDSAGHGVWVWGDADGFSEFGGNRFANNELAPLRIRANHLGTLTADAEFEGHEDNYVLVDRVTTVTSDATWPALDIPYRAGGHITLEDASVTVSPDVRFEFGPSTGIRVEGTSVFVAEGTDSEPIVFESPLADSPGSWYGIVIYSPSFAHSFDHVRIDGGGEEGGFNTRLGGNLILHGGGTTVTNSEFHNSSSYGVRVDELAGEDAEALDGSGNEMTSTADFEAAGNTFQGNDARTNL